MALRPVYELWWETDDDAGDDTWRLVPLVPPDFPDDPDTKGKLAWVSTLVTQRCGGWRAVYTKMKDPMLPWFPDLNVEGHVVIWSALLRDYALDYRPRPST